ncbi:unnamed protein product, partial [marine sediment metagenome]
MYILNSGLKRWVAFLALAILAAFPPVSQAKTYEAIGIRALDGDSILVRFPNGLKEEVRLLSVDCPEHGQALWDQARKFTHWKVAGKDLTLECGPEERDQYNRLLAFIHVHEGHLNMELVEKGLAVVFVIPPNTDLIDSLLMAQARAHARKKGIWGPGGPRLEPRSHRYRKQTQKKGKPR